LRDLHSFPTRRSSDLYLAQSWWRTAVVTDPFDAQRSLDRFATHVADRRPRGQATVGQLASSEPLRAMPSPYPVTISVQRSVTWRSEEHTSELQSRFDL